MTKRSGDSTIDLQVEFPCPDCGATCAAGFEDDRSAAVVHAYPPCTGFLSNESPTAFLRRAREKLSRSTAFAFHGPKGKLPS